MVGRGTVRDCLIGEGGAWYGIGTQSRGPISAQAGGCMALPSCAVPWWGACGVWRVLLYAGSCVRAPGPGGSARARGGASWRGTPASCGAAQRRRRPRRGWRVPPWNHPPPGARSVRPPAQVRARVRVRFRARARARGTWAYRRRWLCTLHGTARGWQLKCTARLRGEAGGGERAGGVVADRDLS